MAIKDAAEHIVINWGVFLNARDEQDALAAKELDNVDEALNRKQVLKAMHSVETDSIA